MKGKNTDFEVVFVSSDRDQAGFDEYFSEMPWFALPYSNRAAKNSLSNKFKVQGIPSLVVLDSDGKIITSEGRMAVTNDPKGDKFPWRPESFDVEFGNAFLGKSGPVDRDSFTDKYIMIYFSAHWCPPCRGFTPKLIKYYNDRKSAGFNDLEIVFASSDKSESEFNTYYGEMPWLSLPFKDPRIEKLSSRFKVEGIPMLVLLDATGKVINKNARGSVESDPKGLKFPYLPEPVVDLSQGVESYGFDINSVPSLVCFMQGLDDDAQASAKQILNTFAVPLTQQLAETEDGPELLFFYSVSPGGIASQIGRMTETKESDEQVTLILLDIPDKGGYYKISLPELTSAAVESFIGGYKSKTLQRCQLKK